MIKFINGSFHRVLPVFWRQENKKALNAPKKEEEKKINMETATKTYSLLSNITFEVANIYLHCVLLLQFTEHCILFHTYYNLLQSHVLLQIQIQNYVRILQ